MHGEIFFYLDAEVIHILLPQQGEAKVNLETVVGETQVMSSHFADAEHSPGWSVKVSLLSSLLSRHFISITA